MEIFNIINAEPKPLNRITSKLPGYFLIWFRIVMIMRTEFHRKQGFSNCSPNVICNMITWNFPKCSISNKKGAYSLFIPRKVLLEIRAISRCLSRRIRTTRNFSAKDKHTQQPLKWKLLLKQRNESLRKQIGRYLPASQNGSTKYLKVFFCNVDVSLRKRGALSFYWKFLKKGSLRPNYLKIAILGNQSSNFTGVLNFVSISLKR